MHDLLAKWWWVLPLLIFLARVCDVTLGTLRVLFLSRGMKALAPVVGFFEILIWITAIAQVVTNLQNVAAYFAYAGGYAMGTYVGLRIEERLALGMLLVRTITQLEGDELVADLRRQNFGVTSMDAHGVSGPVKIVFTIIRRADLAAVLRTVKAYNPNSFYTVEDVRSASPAAARRLIARRQQPQECPPADEVSRILREINSNMKP